MRQLELTYSPSYVGHRAWRGEDEEKIGGVLAAVNAAVEYLERKNVIFELNVAKTTLSEALDEKNDKRVAGEWLVKVLVMLTMRGDEKSAELQRDILNAIAAVAPRFVIAEANDEPSDEWIASTERELAKAKAKKAKSKAAAGKRAA